MSRIGDLLPAAARELGLEEELRRGRLVATFDAVLAELVPAAHGACRAVRLDGATLQVEADAPIVAQELRLRSSELVEALRRAPGAGATIGGLRVTVRMR
jgi:hypothetical protein